MLASFRHCVCFVLRVSDRQSGSLVFEPRRTAARVRDCSVIITRARRAFVFSSRRWGLIRDNEMKQINSGQSAG